MSSETLFTSKRFTASVEVEEGKYQKLSCKATAYNRLNGCGVGLHYKGKYVGWDLAGPRNPITAWRAALILELMSEISPNSTLCDAYSAGRRNQNSQENERARRIISVIGKNVHRSIMAKHVPESILWEILNSQLEPYTSMDLSAIREEVIAGTVSKKWVEKLSDMLERTKRKLDLCSETTREKPRKK